MTYHWRVTPEEVHPLCRRLGYRTGEAPRSVQAEVAYAFLLTLRTDMQVRELLSLTGDNVDLHRCVARVPHVTGRPREVSLSRAAVRLLRPLVQPGRLVFTISSASLETIFREACDSLGIEGVHFRDPPGDGKADYWAERFERAKSDPDEARELLKCFATLASGADGADPLLVQWVAQRMQEWVEGDFQRGTSDRAFRIARRRGRRNNREASKPGLADLHAQTQQAVAIVLKLSRVDGVELDAAAAAATLQVSKGGKGPNKEMVLQAYAASHKAPPADWVPMLAGMDAETRAAVAKPARAGPKPKRRR